MKSISQRMMKSFIIMIMLLAIVSLMACEIKGEESMGKFYALQDAYEEELIAKDDLRHIVFFMNGEVRESIDDGNESIKIDFFPQIKQPQLNDLNDMTLETMCETFYRKNQEIIDSELNRAKGYGLLNPETKAIDTIRIVSFLGEYSGNLAVQIKTDLFEYGDGSFEMHIGDIVWTQFAPEILIYKKG